MIQIETNIPKIQRRFSKLEKSQLPFATALALTRTAKDADDEITRQLPQRFTIRSKWVERGIRIKAATKRTLTAVVFSRDEFLVKQEKGGTRSPKGGRSYLWVPVVGGIRRQKSSRIGLRKVPSAILLKPNVKFIETAEGVGIFQVYKRKSPKLLYWGVPQVRVRKRFDFEPTVRQVVKDRFEPNYRKAFREALATARR